MLYIILQITNVVYECSVTHFTSINPADVPPEPVGGTVD